MSSATRLAAAVLTIVSAVAQSSTQTGSLKSKVVDGSTGQPLRKVGLKLTHVGGGPPLTAASDDQGAFSFDGVEAGDYRLTAERAGYQRLNYGSTSLSRPGMALPIKSGVVSEIGVLRMVPLAVVTGKVVDELGEPLPRTGVVAYRFGYRDGKRFWAFVGGAQADDRGEYRLTNLAPGKFRVAARPVGSTPGILATEQTSMPEKPVAALAATWFGNVVNPSDASTIELSAGESRSNVDITMIRSTVLTIRGAVTPVPNGGVIFITAQGSDAGEIGGNALSAAITNHQAGGRFELSGLLPGSYLLVARASGRDQSAILGVKRVEVSDSNTENLQLSPGGMISLDGVARLAGDAPNAPLLVITLSMSEFTVPDITASPGPDGAFALRGVIPGRHRLRVSGVPENSWIKNVKLNGATVDPDALEIPESGGKLELILAPTAARIAGRVLNSEDQPVPGSAITLIPENGGEWQARVVTADSEGSFQIPSVAPGRYQLLAWQALEAGAHLDRELVRRFEATAEMLALEENGRPSVVLRVIPAN